MGARGMFRVCGRSGGREVYTRMVSCVPVPIRSFGLIQSRFPLGCGLIRDLCLIVVRFLAFRDLCVLSACSRGTLELCSAHFKKNVPETFHEQFSVVGEVLGLKLAFSVWNRSICDALNILKCHDHLFQALSSQSGEVALMEKREACEDAVDYSASYFTEEQLVEMDESDEGGMDVVGFLENRSGYTWCSLSYAHANKLLSVCKRALIEKPAMIRNIQKTIGVFELMAFLHNALISVSAEDAQKLLETEPPEPFVDFAIS